MNLETSVSQLSRVGKVASAKLHQLGMYTAKDLLYYFPFRYEDFRTARSITDLVEGEQVTVQGIIELIAAKRSYRKRTLVTEAVLRDETGQLRVVWFGQPYIAKQLKAGDKVSLSGKVVQEMFGLQMTSPSFEKISAYTESTSAQRLVPMYSLTAGLTQKQVRYIMKQIIHLADTIPEWIPDDIREQARVISLSEALRAIHFPERQDELDQALRRLKFDEVFVLQLRAEMVRQSIQRFEAPRIPFQEDAMKSFVASFPFTLTNGQKIAAWEILKDMERETPMNRLLEGDVGSGKTVVAAMAMYQAAQHGYQSILMAPTEILASQHAASLARMFTNYPVRMALYTRSYAERIGQPPQAQVVSKTQQRANLRASIGDGMVDIVVGTHALLSEDIALKRLGLVIVDEQHRFGVEQRKIIREKSGDPERVPHFLSMTATPIPRSFALTLYGDLDISMITELPAERKSIKTRFVAPHHREAAYQFIRAQVKEGRQVFVICPLIDAGEAGQLVVGDQKKTVMSEYKKLSETVFPDLRVGYLHGKMKSAEKEAVMQSFAEGAMDILVSTSVVEVGVNIPNASVMMIEGAERFGLAQLHQFRGRVGRSSHQSYCFLFTDTLSKTAEERLHFFEKTLNGFSLAEYDLQTRGPGEVYGTSQSGMMHFKLASMRDIDLIKLARALARGMNFTIYTSLKQKVKEWEEQVHLE